ncbi:MAG: hypothetical protein ABIG88_02670 [Patescibacteria group bacterium]|nr:hypothetical protein [Patescibacteria group bacterium]
MNIYVSESVSEVVDTLRTQEISGIGIDYTPQPEDPENPNGYVVLENKNKPYDIIAIISSVIRWRKVHPDWGYPKEAKSCIQIVSLAHEMDFESLIREKVKNLFSLIKED